MGIMLILKNSRESELLWKRAQLSGFVRHHGDGSITTLSSEAHSMLPPQSLVLSQVNSEDCVLCIGLPMILPQFEKGRETQTVLTMSITVF